MLAREVASSYMQSQIVVWCWTPTALVVFFLFPSSEMEGHDCGDSREEEVDAGFILIAP